MKKILLFIAAVMVAMSANAQLYLKGDVNGWGTVADYQLTDKGSGVYELEKTFDLYGKFKIADEGWTEAANYGADGADADITAGQATTVVCNKDSKNLAVPAGTKLAVSKVVLNTNDMTITVYAEEQELGDNYTYALHGSFNSSNWESIDMTESNGIWTIAELVVAQDAQFGVKQMNNGVQTAWYWSESGADVSAYATYQFTLEGEGTGSNASIVAGTYSISFDPSSLILTVAAATEQPEEPTAIDEVDAEDAVVAAYDLLGRPVAADAAGYVILQYASGKAAKVFNN